MSMDKPTSRSFPICPKCNESCFKSDGQLVRALNQVYHYSCFVCEDCSLSVADKYYYLIEKRRRIILCQYHYTKRSAMETVGCVQCPPKTIHSFYYELNGKSYCRIHYSLLPKTQCFGCHQAVLKQFVQHRDIPEKIWHPECYMIYKFWGVKLAPLHQPGSDELIKCQAMIENTVNRVWTDLSSFEESAANCISDMLLHVASGSYSETIDVTNQFIMHLEVLFNALDFIDLQLISFGSSLNCSREASFVCSQILQFLELLNHPSPTITQDLSSLVTGLAQNLKSLIRIGLSTSLRLEQELEIENTILNFLQYLLALEKKRVWIDGRYWFKENIAQIEQLNITCHQCNLTITEEYYTCRELYWHPSCFQCSVCSEHINYKEPVAFDERNQPICCAVPNQTLFTCTYISLLQHLLYNLKLHLSQVTNKQALYNKEDNTVLLLGSKRRKSLLGILNKQQQQPTETNKIHLGQVQSSYEIRRAFSMGSSSAPISNLFRKHSKKSPKRASVFSLHGHAFIQTLPSSQDCLLHHVAALSLQPLLNNAVLDTKSSPPAHHPSVLWGKLMTHIKAKNMNEHRIFGVPLSVVVNRDKERTRTKTNAMTCFDFSTGLTASFSENASIPIFIKSLITTILQTDMSVEGVFRKNGNIRQLKLLADSIDKLNDQTLSEQSIGEAQRRLLVNQSPIQLAALLKRYLRELPEPLLTFGLYKLFIQCGKMDNSKHLLHIACCLLPKPNRDTMLMIFCCLKWIGGFSETNRMDICNLARVIAPSVLYSSPPHTCDGELRQGTQDEILVIENLIKYSDDMSVIPPDLILLPIQTDEKKNGQRRLSWIPGKNK